ncbi:MAG: aminomethyltransferase family protein [Acidobacteria bacterium]|nr:aminomethyltransferase family protein [Acidobacteriota bacterium]
MEETSPDAPAATPLPLDELHLAFGARHTEVHGRIVPADFGDPAAEYRALRDGAALLDRSWVEHLVLTGEDRQRFLHGQVTCDVKALAPGQGTYGFFTTAKGRIEADVVVLATEDRLVLELPPGLAAPIAARLEKYVIADRVEIARPATVVTLALVGPEAEAAVNAWATPDGLPCEAWEHRPVTALGQPATLLRHPRLGVAGYQLLLDGASAEEVAKALLEDVPGIRPVGFSAYEMLRVEAGVPRFGDDFGPDNFPQETGIDEAVSYTKGCYLGQEVVARLHYRGQVARQLRGLVVAGDQVPAPGTELSLEDRPAGAITSAAWSPALGRPLALALLQRRAFEPGTRVELSGGVEAKVRSLPHS